MSILARMELTRGLSWAREYANYAQPAPGEAIASATEAGLQQEFAEEGEDVIPELEMIKLGAAIAASQKHYMAILSPVMRELMIALLRAVDPLEQQRRVHIVVKAASDFSCYKTHITHTGYFG